MGSTATNARRRRLERARARRGGGWGTRLGGDFEKMNVTVQTAFFMKRRVARRRRRDDGARKGRARARVMGCG